MRNTRIIRADVDFVTWLRQSYPGMKDPERTRRILDNCTLHNKLSKKLDIILYGREKIK